MVDQSQESAAYVQAQRQALFEAADAWTRGAWADTPRHTDRARDRIAAANFFGDWLRARAEALTGPEVTP